MQLLLDEVESMLGNRDVLVLLGKRCLKRSQHCFQQFPRFFMAPHFRQNLRKSVLRNGD